MPIIHYNQIERTACFLPRWQVYVTNSKVNVNCQACKDFIEDKEIKEVKLMTQCPTCNTELPSNHPAIQTKLLLEFVEKAGGWSVFESYEEGQRLPGLSAISIAAIKPTYDSGDIDIEGYYGESALPQGSEFQAYVVFKIGDTFYKKTGTGDSYGDVQWDGDLRQVEATSRTVWEFK